MTYKFLLVISSMLIFSQVAYAIDLKNGKTQHNKHCTSCHIAKYAGDGSKIYTRKNRLINNYSSLIQRVKACDINTNAGLHDDEVKNVIEYINESYYHFKK